MKNAENELLEAYYDNVKKNNQVITVFMLTHNREKYVRYALDSLLNQTYNNFTIIVLDNCSVDNTSNVVKSFDNKRVLYLYRESIEGSTNTDYAKEKVITKYFAVVHDDDIYKPNYIEVVLNELSKNEQIVALSVPSEIIDSDGNRTGKSFRFDANLYWSGHQYLESFMTVTGIGMFYPSTVYKADFYKKFDLFGGNSEIGPAGDQFIWFETERLGGCLCLYREPLFFYRVHNHQESHNNKGVMELQLIDYILKIKYYDEIIKQSNIDISRIVYRGFKKMFLQYSLNIIDEFRFKTFFSYICVNVYLKKKNRVVFYFCKIIFLTRNLLKLFLPIYRLLFNE